MIKIPIFFAEFSMVCVVTAVIASVIQTFDHPVPVLSFIIPDLIVNDVLGFFLALVVVGTPIFVWKNAFESTLFPDTHAFFKSQNNVIWFGVGVLGLLGVFAFETFSFYSSALSELETVTPCSKSNPFRPPEVCDREIAAIEQKIERSVPYAFLISTANIMIGAGAAYAIHKK